MPLIPPCRPYPPFGGGNTLDYTEDARAPRLSSEDTDYLRFTGDRVDTTFIGAAAADVKLCPGDRSHFEILQRGGFRDMMAYHPGVNAGLAHEALPDDSRFWATLGTGRVAVPHT